MDGADVSLIFRVVNELKRSGIAWVSNCEAELDRSEENGLGASIFALLLEQQLNLIYSKICVANFIAVLIK